MDRVATVNERCRTSALYIVPDAIERVKVTAHLHMSELRTLSSTVSKARSHFASLL